MGLRSRPGQVRDAGKACRLTVARGFLGYLLAVEPGTEVSPHRLLATLRQRRPYIFSDAEIEGLVAVAAGRPPAPRRSGPPADLGNQVPKVALGAAAPSARAALARYLQHREALGYDALSDAVFMAEAGGRLDVGLLGAWFRSLTRKLGL